MLLLPKFQCTITPDVHNIIIFSYQLCLARILIVLKYHKQLITKLLNNNSHLKLCSTIKNFEEKFDISNIN